MQIVIVLSFFIALRLNQCLSFISIHCIHCVCATMRRGHLCNHQRRRRININCLCELCLVRDSNCENWRQTGHAIHWLAIWNSNSFFFLLIFQWFYWKTTFTFDIARLPSGYGNRRVCNLYGFLFIPSARLANMPIEFIRPIFDESWSQFEMSDEPKRIRENHTSIQNSDLVL